MPKSVERLMKLKQMTKEGFFDKQKKKKEKHKKNLMDTSRLLGTEKILPGMSKPDRTLPRLVQRPGESNKTFLYRVSQATNDFVKEVKFEVKHNMKMKRDETTGEVKFDKVEVHPVDKMFKDKLEASNSRKSKYSKKKKVAEELLSKTGRRRLRHQAKKEHLRELKGEGVDDGKDDFHQLRDKIEFNEVVHRPPQLTALPRKAIITSDEGIARRPASKPGLLLSKMFTDGERRDLTGKRKDLSMSDRRRLESAQADAISAYRQMKAKRSILVT
ncbi:coiled-coil domain-containing protein 137 isoform X2 [Macrosteles quadrilineatus]|nr:coiled-coil domain-containing protein 137 isoform X2 [Macrosteles quadrilineatus]